MRMKKLVLGMATVFMLMLGSVSPVLAYEYDGVDTSEMTQEELWAAQEKHLQERMEASEDMQKTKKTVDTMFQVFPVLMVIMVGGTVICSIYNAFSTSHISDDMSEWSNSSSKDDYNNYDQRDYEQAVEEQIKVHASVHKQEKEIKKNSNLFDDDYLI